MNRSLATGNTASAGRRAPLVTLAISVLALALFFLPDTFQLTREGLGRGEVWRFFTGHLTHFSAGHLFVDVLTLLVLGVLYERSVGSLKWLVLLLGSGVAISAAFLLTESHLEGYRGLSGLACAAFAVAILVERRRRPVLATGLGVLFAAKILFEQLTGGFLFPAVGAGDMGEPVLSAHTAGAAVGFLLGWVFLRPGPETSERGSAAIPRPLALR